MAGRLPPSVLANRLRGLQAADWFERSTGVRGRIAADVARFERSDLARRALDLARMRRLVEQWPAAGASDDSLMLDYNCVLERGLMVGRFLLWFEAEGSAGSAVSR